MKKIAINILLALFVCVPFVSVVIAQPPPVKLGSAPDQTAPAQNQSAPRPRNLQDEQVIYDQLKKRAPKAVDTFKAATEALDANDFPTALELYNEVLGQAPDFDAALRRSGYAMASTGDRENGIARVKKALDANRSAENLLGMAIIIVSYREQNNPPTEPELIQSLGYAREANEKKNGKDFEVRALVAQLYLVLRKNDDFNSFVEALKKDFPDEALSHYYNGIRQANYGAWGAAKDEMNLAAAKGMTRAETDFAIAQIDNAIAQENAWPWWMQYGFYAVVLLALWAVGLLLLFIVGKVLSVMTLRSVEASDPNDVTGGGQAGLRAFYRWLILFGGIYYYVSQPFVVLLVVTATAGAALFFLIIGWVPIKLLFVFAIVGLVAIFYMVRSIFIRINLDDPGRVLSETEAPGLWKLVREVAEDIKTRPVTEIRITPGTDLAVYERGGMRAKLSDSGERILIIGTAVLNGFHQNPFRAVLAHEYGHFSNRDTAGGDIAMYVNNHIMGLAIAMAQSGWATVYNVAFQFLRIYHFIFRRITHGATRLQEILADRAAAYHYGVDAFREGLTHVIRREVEFNHLANREVSAALSTNRPLQNLYELNAPDADRQELDTEVNAIITRATTEDDTHPSPEDRFRFIAPVRSREVAKIDGMVWDLFTDREGLTGEMNKTLEGAIRAGY